MVKEQKADIERLVWPKDATKFQWIDRLEKIVDAATKLGIAYAGANALKHPMGAVVGLVAYKLAQSNNLASGAVGSATLAGIGLLNYVPATDGPAGTVTEKEPIPIVTDPRGKYPFESWLTFFYREGKFIEEESWIQPIASIPPGTGEQPYWWIHRPLK